MDKKLQRQPAREVAPGVFMVRQSIGHKKQSFSVNVYVIAGKDGLVFDGGYGHKGEQRYLTEQIRQISERISSGGGNLAATRALPSHSHWDHFSGLSYLQRTLGLDILATQSQVGVISSKPQFKRSLWSESALLRYKAPPLYQIFRNLKKTVSDALFIHLLKVRFVAGPIEVIDDDAALYINNENWQVMSLPGHCSDDIALYNRERGILLGGDIILNRITTWLGPPRSNLAQYIQSLESLLTLPELKVVFPAHGSPVTDPVHRIKAAIQHRKNRTASVLDMILGSGENGVSFEMLFRHFYKNPPWSKRKLLGGWIGITLEYLYDRGEIEVRREKGRVIFRGV